MIESRFIEADGLRLHCRVAGDPSRPLMLFLHGFPEYAGAWEEMFARFSGDFLCVAPDQRGYGLSDRPEGVAAYSAGKLARDAAAVLTAFAPKAHAVIGHDWGASVAYALSFARPELMARLVILNGVHPGPYQRALAAGGAQSEAAQYIHALRAEDAEARFAADGFARLFRLFSGAGMDMGWLDDARRAQYLTEWSRPGALTAMLNWYRAAPVVIAEPGNPIADPPAWPREALRVRVPHLLIWGRDDGALLPEATEGLEDWCDDLTRVEITGADHWLHHQKPDEVAAAVRAHILQRNA